MAANFAQELDLIARGLWPVAGVDEAGRGPLAGPVAAAAVILDPGNVPDGLADSKALDGVARERLFDEIMNKAVAVAVSLSDAAEIDRINIRAATHAAMKRALAALSAPAHFALIDGHEIPANLPILARAIIKGDATCASISAASIIAKVTRDRLMVRAALLHPDYGFEVHMGYGTPVHLKAISDLGPCPFHRRTFAPVREEIAKRLG